MTWLDVLILLPLILGLIRGLMRGVIVEVMAIVAVIAGFICAKYFGAGFAIWLSQQFSWPEAVCAVVAYALLFIGSSLLLNIIAKLLSKLFKAVYLGWLNRILGAIFGVAKWGAIMLLIILCLHRLDNQFHFLSDDLKNKSFLYEQTTPLAEKAWNKVKEQTTQLSK